MPRLVENATARERGTLTSTGAPMVDSTSWTESPHLASAMFRTTCLPSGRMSSWRRMSSPERRPRTLGMSMALTQTTSVHASMAASPISGKPGGGVHNDVLEFFRQLFQQAGDLFGRDVVGVDRVVGRAQGVDAGGVNREERLEHQGVLAGSGGDGVRDRVLRVEVEAGGDVAKLQVRSTITTLMGAILPRPTARLVAMVVLPTPPLGEKTPITRPLLLSACLGCSGRWRLAKDWQARSSSTRMLCGVGGRAEDVPDAGAHGLQDELRIRFADQENRKVRDLDVEHGGQAQRLVDGHIRAEDEDLGLFLVELGEQVVGAGGQDIGEERLHAALEPARNCLPQAAVEVRVRRDQDEAAHL